ARRNRLELLSWRQPDQRLRERHRRHRLRIAWTRPSGEASAAETPLGREAKLRGRCRLTVEQGVKAAHGPPQLCRILRPVHRHWPVQVAVAAVPGPIMAI